MSPDLLGLPAYPLCLLAGALLGLAVAWWSASHAGLARAEFVRSVLVLLAIGLLGARAHAILEAGLSGGFSSSLLLGTGMRYPGGALAGFVCLPLVLRRLGRSISVRQFADVVAPAIALGLAVDRVGCLLHGCCYGIPSSLPWAIRFPAGSIAWSDQVSAGWLAASAPLSLPVHPLQLYFGAWSLVVGVTLLVLQRRSLPEGTVFALFCVLHESGKAALELLRAPAPLPHLIVPSIALALGGAIALLVHHHGSPLAIDPSRQRVPQEIIA